MRKIKKIQYEVCMCRGGYHTANGLPPSDEPGNMNPCIEEENPILVPAPVEVNTAPSLPVPVESSSSSSQQSHQVPALTGTQCYESHPCVDPTQSFCNPTSGLCEKCTSNNQVY